MPTKLKAHAPERRKRMKMPAPARERLPDTLAAEYIAGATCHELAKRHGTNHATVWNRLLDLGVNCRRSGARQPSDNHYTRKFSHLHAAIRAMRSEGKPFHYIGGHFGLSASGVRDICNRASN